MKKIKLFAVILIAAALLLVLSVKVNAASASLSVSESEIKPGESFTVTVTADSVASWSIHVSASGPVSGDGINDVDVTSDAQNTTKTFSTTYTATEAGTITVRLTGDVMGTEDDDATEFDKSATVTVVEPEPIVEQEPAKEPEKEPEQPTTNPEPAKEPEKEPEPEPVKEPTKSSNANLSNLGITPNDFTGFRYSVTSYDVSVPYDTSEIEIYAEKFEDSQTITGTGSKSLSEGSNVFDITVTAEDGTTKTYTLTIVRLAKEQTSQPNINNNNNNESKIELALSSIEIEGVTLNETFKPNVYEYTAKASKDAKMVTVKATANIQDALVEVDAPKEFTDGETTIKITVKEKEGNSKKIYVIKVTKEAKEAETKVQNVIPTTIGKTTSNNKGGGSGLSTETIIYCIGVAIVTALGILFAVIRYRKDQGYGYEEDDEDEFDFVGDISTKEAMIDAAVATSKLARNNAETAEEGPSERRKGKHF